MTDPQTHDTFVDLSFLPQSCFGVKTPFPCTHRYTFACIQTGIDVLTGSLKSPQSTYAYLLMVNLTRSLGSPNTRELCAILVLLLKNRVFIIRHFSEVVSEDISLLLNHCSVNLRLAETISISFVFIRGLHTNSYSICESLPCPRCER